MMKAWIMSGCTIGVAALMSGCSTFDGTIFDTRPDPEVARVATTTQQMNMELRQISEQVSEIRRNQQDLDTRLNRMEVQLSAGGRTQEDITALRRDIQMLRADRETLKKEITTDLAGRISQVTQQMNKPPANTASAKPRTGVEHKVLRGQTLSEIARGYGKSIDSIMKANSLKDAGSLREGQILFIPD